MRLKKQTEGQLQARFLVSDSHEGQLLATSPTAPSFPNRISILVAFFSTSLHLLWPCSRRYVKDGRVWRLPPTGYRQMIDCWAIASVVIAPNTTRSSRTSTRR